MSDQVLGVIRKARLGVIINDFQRPIFVGSPTSEYLKNAIIQFIG